MAFNQKRELKKNKKEAKFASHRSLNKNPSNEMTNGADTILMQDESYSGND